MTMGYLVSIRDNTAGRVVRQERAGSSGMAQSMAAYWRQQGFTVVVTTESGGSTPY